MTGEFGGRARFAVENYGDSALAKRFGVTRYPAIFVGDVLVATPSDFGFYGKGEGEGGGRYAPLKSAKSHARFREDLSRMIELLLAGDAAAARERAVSEESGAVAAWPADFSVTDIDGKPLAAADLAGRAVLVDFWATWCPPCLGSLPWVASLPRKYGDRLAVVAIAVESPEARTREIAKEKGGSAPGVRFVQGTPDLVRSFGDVSAVPTLLLFDRDGKLAESFFGAPPGQHAAVEARIDAVLR